MDDEILRALSRILGVDGGAVASLVALFERRELADGDVLKSPGRGKPETAIVLSGVVRHYLIDEGGRDRTTDFCRAGELTGDSPGAPEDGQWIAAVGPVSLAVAPTGPLVAAVEAEPRLQAAFARVLLGYLGLKSRREAALLSLGPAGRYEAFLRDFPDLAEALPQYLIASYLGIAPETLSRVRARKAR